MAFDVHETSVSDKDGSVRLIDLTEEGSEAPFAVREADGSTGAVPRRIPDKVEILAWLEEHPVGVGIATGVLCFTIIASAMSIVLGSDSNFDSGDPAASAALSETDGGQGSFSSSGSGGANFTSDDSKLSRSGAGKVAGGAASGESAAGANSKGSPARNSQSTDPWSGGSSDLDQSATLNGRTPAGGNGAGQAAGNGAGQAPGNGVGQATGNDVGQAAGPGSSTTRPAAAGAPATTLNPGPNMSAPMPTTATTSRATTPTNQITATTALQTSSTPPSSAPTTPTTTPTTPTTPAPASLMIASPGHGSIHPFESSTSFAVSSVAGATQYCWKFIQSGATAHQSCSSGTSYQLPAYPDGLGPGLVTVEATATGSFGILTHTIQISLYRSMVINNPTQDLTIGRSPLRVGVVNLIGATQYCFRLTQDGYDSGTLCYNTPGKTFNRNDPIWDWLSPGPLTVSATIKGGGLTLAVDSVTIQLL